MTHPDDDALAAIALGDPAPSGAAEHARSCASCSETLAALRDTMTTLRDPAPGARGAAVLGVGCRGGRDRPRARHHRRPVATAGAGAPGIRSVDAGDDLAPAARRPQRRGAGSRSPGSPVRQPPGWSSAPSARGLVDGDEAARRGHRREHQPRHPRHPAGQGHGRRRARGRPARPRGEHPADRPRQRLPRGVADQQGPQADGLGRGARAGRGRRSRSPSRRTLLDQGYVIVDISREGFDDSPAALR